MLSREELEFIWETQPHGYFPKLVKELKSRNKLNKYSVTARFYELNRVEVGAAQEEVYATSSTSSAIENLKSKLRRKLSSSNDKTNIVCDYEIKLLTPAKK